MNPRTRLAAFLGFAAHRTAWLSALAGTAVMAAWFVLTLEAASLLDALRGVPATVLLAAAACLALNGALDITWLKVVLRGPAARSEASRVVAWHLLLTAVLPARLGDLGWIYFIHRWLRLPPARAIFVALYHRLQDFLVITLLLVIALAASGTEWLGATFAVVTAGSLLALVLVLVCIWLGRLLTGAALALTALRRRWRHPLLRHLLRQVLGVRLWYRHELGRAQVAWSFLVILARWLAIVAAIGLVVAALAAPLDAPDALLLANLYIYMGVVPLQAVGGFGAGEAGLAWALTFYGVGLAQASAVGFLLRLLINVTHVALWLMILAARAALALTRRRRR